MEGHPLACPITERWPLRHSHEPIAEILAAFHTGQRFDVHLNLRNRGAIAGVSPETHIELFCRIENGEAHKRRVKFPERITEVIERVGASQQLLARCCETYDEDLLIEALSLDALTPKNKETIRRLMREMLAFQDELISRPDHKARS